VLPGTFRHIAFGMLRAQHEAGFKGGDMAGTDGFPAGCKGE